MIRITADGKDGPLVILGLSKENIRRLQQGKPISVPAGGDLGLNKQIVIFTGDSEQAMLNDLRPLIGPESRVHVDPRLGETG